MSTLFHEPIEVGESNSPDTINDRLAALDSAIATLDEAFDDLITGSGTSDAETLAARTSINYKAGTPPSTLATTISYAATDIYNVKAYGAVGNGITNDRAAIQAAIDAAYNAGGGIVFLPRGTYYLDSSGGVCLTVKDYVTLRGAGAKSILDFHGSDGADCITMAGMINAGVENLRIQNLIAVSGHCAITSDANTQSMVVRNVIIRGNTITKAISNIVANGTTLTVTASNHGFATGDDVYVYGTGTTGNTTTLDVLWDSITVTDANTFTHSTSRTNSAATGVAQKTTWFDGIRIQGTDAIVDGCEITTGFYSAIRHGETANRAKVTRCTIRDGFRGIMFDEGTPGAAYNIVAHNHLDALKQAAGKIESTCAHNIVCDNTITNCSNLAYADATFEIVGPYSTFERNHMFFTSPISVSAIDTVTTPGHITIRDNVVEAHNGTVINIRTGMTFCEVVGNQINGGARGIQAVGSNIMIAGNRISNMVDYGIVIANITYFVVQNNTIINVTNLNGIRLTNACNYGTIMANIIVNVGTDGINQGNSGDPGSYVAFIGNVIADVGNAAGAGYSMSFSANAPKMAVVGNVAFDTPETSNIRGTSLSSAVLIGNATQKGVLVSGTTVTNTNNL